jgi:hypothetical protein
MRYLITRQLVNTTIVRGDCDNLSEVSRGEPRSKLMPSFTFVIIAKTVTKRFALIVDAVTKGMARSGAIVSATAVGALDLRVA